MLRAEEIQLSLGGAHGVEVARSESSLPWEATRAARRRQPYLGFHNKHTDLPTVAKKWGRKVLFEDGEQRSDDEDEEKKSRHPCVCVHDDSSGFGCLICSIARQLSVASDSEEVVDIVTDKCQDVPRISTTKLPPFPDYRDVDVVPQKLVEVERQAYTPRTFQDPTKEKEERIEGKKQDQISPAFSHPKIAKLKSKVDQTLEKDAQLDPSNNSSSRAMSIVSPKTGSLDMDIIKLEEDKGEEKEEKTHLTSSDSKIFQTNLKERKEEISESEVSKSQQKKSRLTSSEESNSQKLRKLSSKTGSLVMETSSQEDASAKYKEDPQASLTSNDPKISKFKLEVSQLLEKNSKVNLSKNLFLKGLPKLGTPDLDTSSQKSEVEQTSRTTVHSAFTNSKETISATSTHLENSKQGSIESFEKAEVKRASHTAVKHAGNESTEASEQSEHGSDVAMPFPSAACCRAPTKKRCTCVDQRKKPGDLDLTERNIAMYTRHAGDCSSKDPIPEKPRKVCACIDNAKLKKRPPRPWPITAKNFTQAEETKLKKKHEKECAVNPISDTVAKALQLSQKNSTLEAEPVAFDPNNFTSPEVPSKNAGVSYWAKDRDSVSEFSRPDLDDCSSNGEYCLVCNGRITLVEQQPKPFAYRYLVKHEADERYEGKSTFCFFFKLG
ncbi:unnamed protein product [Clavelina lepadiformis]|uniref:Uncharacterized protein n=1 Tax=Clavelina lepadiformis TaxID=159417 RepID=A0ABP0FYG1_CLALP